MRTNYVLIDYENVRPESISALESGHFKVFLFVGADQAKITFELAESMQRLGERGRYVKISGNGPNALDFHIAFYIGQFVVEEPSAYFHIISKDTGFDPLVAHLKVRKVSVLRSKSIEDIPILRQAESNTMPVRVAAAVADLHRRGASKPRTAKTLIGSLSALNQSQLNESETTELVAELQRLGYVAFDGSKVAYALPEKI